MHPFEKSGLGKAPFRFVTMFSFPAPSLGEQNPNAYMEACQEAANIAKSHGVRGGICEHCGMALMNNFIIRSADGHKHVVGCDCVAKTRLSDAALARAVEAAVKAREKTKRAERKETKRANAEATRKANRRRLRRELFGQHGALLIEAFKLRKGNAFATSILQQAWTTGRLTANQISALQRWIDKGRAVKAERDADAARRAASRHIGEIGKRIETTVTCLKHFVRNDPFGPVWRLTILQDADGNTLKCFGRCLIDVGVTAKVRLTVKRHDTYEDEKQTIVNRLKVL